MQKLVSVSKEKRSHYIGMGSVRTERGRLRDQIAQHSVFLGVEYCRKTSYVTFQRQMTS